MKIIAGYMMVGIQIWCEASHVQQKYNMSHICNLKYSSMYICNNKTGEIKLNIFYLTKYTPNMIIFNM